MATFDAHANFGYGLVSVAPSPDTSGTTLELGGGAAALMPAVPFNATVWPPNVIPLSTNAEIVRVTNIAGSVLTITRAQESSSAMAIAVGWSFANTVTAKSFTDIEALLDQAVKTTSTPQFGKVGIGTATLDTDVYLNIDRSSTGDTIVRINGSVASQNRSAILQLSGRGSSKVATIGFYADGDFASEPQASIKRNGVSTTDLEVYGSQGILAFNFGAGLTVNNSSVLPLYVLDTTDASSSTTGSFRVAGGMGIAKKLFVGTDITLGGSLQLGNAYVATPQVTTGYVTLKDSGGTTYKVLVAT